MSALPDLISTSSDGTSRTYDPPSRPSPWHPCTPPPNPESLISPFSSLLEFLQDPYHLTLVHPTPRLPRPMAPRPRPASWPVGPRAAEAAAAGAAPPASTRAAVAGAAGAEAPPPAPQRPLWASHVPAGVRGGRPRKPPHPPLRTQAPHTTMPHNGGTGGGGTGHKSRRGRGCLRPAAIRACTRGTWQPRGGVADLQEARSSRRAHVCMSSTCSRDVPMPCLHALSRVDIPCSHTSLQPSPYVLRVLTM